MNGVLSFTLGLETSNFLRGLGLASGGILSFAGAFKALQFGLGSFWNAIQDGGRLDDLSKRTGTSVRDLYQLEEAFKMVGLSADQVPSMILRMRQALGGVDEAGNRTDKAFAALGISMEDLAKVDAPKQFEMLSEALNNSGSNADSLAKMLFGREGAGNMMQLARSSDDVAQSFKDTASAAERMQRASGVFDSVGDGLQRLKTALNGFWIKLAADAAPVLQWMVSSLTKVFEEGALFQLIVDSFKFAFETVLDFAPAVFAKLGSMMLNEMRTPLVALQSMLEYYLMKPFENAFKWMSAMEAYSRGGIWAAVADYAKSERYGSSSFEEIFARNMKTGPRFNLGNGEFGLEDISKQADEAIQKALQKLKARFPSLKLDPFNPNRNNNLDNDLTSNKNAGKEASVLEKMGFIMHGGGTGSRVENLLQRIVDNTNPRNNSRRYPVGGLTGINAVS
jgi:hypothetical protein